MPVSSIWTNLTTLSPDECWPWPGRLSRDGYGKSGPRMAHQIAFEMAFGPVPDGLEIDHLCHTRDTTCSGQSDCQHRRCVNPAHLEAVTHEENVRRGRRHSPMNRSIRPPRQHCRKGHRLDEGNTYQLPSKPGQRLCRECNRQACAAYYERHRTSSTKRAPRTGVSMDSSKGQWRARATINGRYRHLGYFATQEAALLRVQTARQEAAS